MEQVDFTNNCPKERSLSISNKYLIGSWRMIVNMNQASVLLFLILINAMGGGSIWENMVHLCKVPNVVINCCIFMYCCCIWINEINYVKMTILDSKYLCTALPPVSSLRLRPVSYSFLYSSEHPQPSAWHSYSKKIGFEWNWI